MALVTAMMALLMMLALGAGVAMTTLTEGTIAANHRDGIQARSADALRERHGKNAEIVRKRRPHLRPEAGRRANGRAAFLEAVVILQPGAHGVAQLFLFARQSKVDGHRSMLPTPRRQPPYRNR